MRVIVLGANRRTGQHVLQVALERGFDVTAVVRSHDKQPSIKHERLTATIGDPCNPEFLTKVFRGQDVVISTLGGRRPTKAATSVYFQSADAIVAAACDTGLKRVLVTSTALLFPPRTLVEKILSLIVRHIVRSAARMEQVLKASDLDWTVARCGFLTSEEEPKYRSEQGRSPLNGSSVSRLGLAHFLVDAIERPDSSCQVFGVSSPEKQPKPK